MQSKFIFMRKLFFTAILALCITSLFAQDQITDQDKKVNFSVDIFYDIWQNMPDDMSNNGLSFGNSFYVMYEQFIWKKDGKFRIALGGGITTHKLSTNTYIEDVNSAPITFTPIGEDIDFKKSKFVVNYLDFMGELRYKTTSKFRLALGLKIGFRVDSHTTYKGEELDNSDIDITVKNKDIKFIEKLKVAPTFRVGYGFASLFVSYSVTKLFNETNGPELYPISVGFTLNPF